MLSDLSCHDFILRESIEIGALVAYGLIRILLVFCRIRLGELES